MSPIKFIKRVNDTLNKPKKKGGKELKTEDLGVKTVKKHQRMIIFINEYVKTLNGTQSAIKAGYKPQNANSTAYKILQNPKVRAKIDDLLKKRLIDCKVDTEFILQQLKDISLNPKCPFKDRVKSLELLGRYINLWEGNNTPAPTKVTINLTE